MIIMVIVKIKYHHIIYKKNIKKIYVSTDKLIGNNLEIFNFRHNSCTNQNDKDECEGFFQNYNAIKFTPLKI